MLKHTLSNPQDRLTTDVSVALRRFHAQHDGCFRKAPATVRLMACFLPALITPSDGNRFRLSGSQRRISESPALSFLPSLIMLHFLLLGCLMSELFYFSCGFSLTSGGCLWPFSRQDSDGWAHEAIVRFLLGLRTRVASSLWRNLTPPSNKGSVCLTREKDRSRSPLGSRSVSNVDLGKLSTTSFRGHLCCLLSPGEGVSPHLIPLTLPALLFLPPVRMTFFLLSA